MQSIIRNVRDISTGDRHALEHVIGQLLEEHQQVIVQVVNLPPASNGTAPPTAPAALPDWCHVNDGLTEEELQQLDRAISQRLDLTRS